MRIVFISQGYPPAEGGVATSTQRVSRNLTELGCEILVLTFEYGPGEQEVDKLEMDGAIEVHRIGPFFQRHDIDDNEASDARRRVYNRMETLARAFCPQAVLSFDAVNAGLLGAYVASAVEVPHIAGVRGNDAGRHIFSTNWMPTLRSILEMSAAVVCVNQHLKRRVTIAYPHLRERISVIHNGSELPIVPRSPRVRPYIAGETDWPADALVGVYLGSPRSKKGIHTLLRAVETLEPEVRPRLLFIGPRQREAERAQCGAEWDRLEATSWLHVTGQLDRSRALEIAQEGDLILMPSIDDGLANGLLEGMALGLCPIASDIFTDVVVPGVSGWIFPKGDTLALAATLREAGGNAWLRSAFAAAAQIRVKKNHSPQREAERYMQVLQAVTAPAFSLQSQEISISTGS